MPRKKPTHGGARPNAGRPKSTGSKGTPLIQFRVSAALYRDLEVLGLSKPARTPSRVAKDIVTAVVARTQVSGEAATKKP